MSPPLLPSSSIPFLFFLSGGEEGGVGREKEKREGEEGRDGGAGKERRKREELGERERKGGRRVKE